MKSSILKPGVIAGLIPVVFMVIFSTVWNNDKPNFELGEILGYLGITVGMVIIYFALRSHKNQTLQGQMSFKQGFLMGFYISLVSSCIYAIGWMIFYNGFATDFMDRYYEYAVQKLKNSNLDPKKLEQQVKNIEDMKEMYKNPLVQFGFTFFEIFPIALIVSAISAVILRKKSASHQKSTKP